MGILLYLNVRLLQGATEEQPGSGLMVSATVSKKKAHFATGIHEPELRITNSGHVSYVDGTKQLAWRWLSLVHFRLSFLFSFFVLFCGL